jgi:hypothetical protein
MEKLDELLIDKWKGGGLGFAFEDTRAIHFYEWMVMHMSAATGDYSQIDPILASTYEIREQVAEAYKRQNVKGFLVPLLQMTTLSPGYLRDALWYSPQRLALEQGIRDSMALKPQKADLTAVRAILALEAGDNQRAERLFREAAAQDPESIRPIAEYYLDLFAANRR